MKMETISFFAIPRNLKKMQFNNNLISMYPSINNFLIILYALSTL